MHAQQKLTAWKHKLLDLGKRNRLLFFKPTKRTTLRLVEPTLTAIFERLVQQGNSYEFPMPLRQATFDDLSEEESDGNELDGAEKLIPLRPGQIRADQADTQLMRTLHQIRQKARTAIQEQGVNVLYVACGFLDWTESESSREAIRSPLLLIPVELQIESIMDPYRLAPYDDDVTLNPTLLHKLANDFGISLPTLPEEDDWDIDAYLDAVQTRVEAKGWKVTREAQLGLFSFLKLNMYKDLDAYAAEMAEHPLIGAIAGDSSRLPALPDVPSADELDRRIYPHEVFQVLDADSSQQAAILYAKRGASFVLQGPPGTGKSQTITNMIAECLAAGKRVLFVSEKMAALEVVFRRLQENRLGDFSLQLHSHKANKKDVIAELSRTLNAKKTTGTSRVEDQLDQLLQQREHLNSVVTALHAVRQPLGLSVYEIHGRVALLESAPNLSFRFLSGAGSRTPAELRRFETLLSQLALTAERVGADYFANPWNRCIAPSFSLELQQDIKTHFGRLQALLQELDGLFTTMSERLGFDGPTTLQQMERVAELLALVGDSPMPPAEWFAHESLGTLVETASTHLELSARHQERRSQLLRRCRAEIFGIEPARYMRVLEELPREILTAFVSQYLPGRESLIESRGELPYFLEQVSSTLGLLRRTSEELASSITVSWDGTAATVPGLVTLARLVAKDSRPLAAWFDTANLRLLVNRAREAKEAYARLQKDEEALFRRYDRELLALDITQLVQRFRTDYVGILRFVKPAYHRDMKVLRALLKSTEKLTNLQVGQDLATAKDLLEARRWIEERQTGLREAFGDWFLGADTQWNELLSALEACGAILAHFHPDLPPASVRELLMRSSGGVKEVAGRLPPVELALREATPLLERLSGRLRSKASTGPRREVGTDSLQDLSGWAVAMLSSVTEFYHAYDAVVQFTTAPTRLKVAEVVQDLQAVAKVQAIEEQLHREATALQTTFGRFFHGMETEWQAVLNALDWTANVLRYFDPASPTEAFVQAVSSERNLVEDARRAAVASGNLLEEVFHECEFVVGLFEARTFDPKRPPVNELQRWLQTRIDNLAQLQDWIDFRGSREDCAKAGLAPFVEEVLNTRIPPDQIKDAFLKRFYRLWLDEVYGQVPQLQSFRGRRHADQIREFRELDRLQFRLAQIRLREKLSAQRPTAQGMNAKGSEVAALQREAEKRRKQVPLRRLFQAIPNLLLTLKPCLLMSPLSVSQFLDPQLYKFDVVIFDEASQICSEDAIGAIFRGKQLIVVGDREQLPPTNFFGTSVGDAGFDDEEDDTEAYESILDECSPVLHRTSLKWHYRSRHEHLIAFSNTEIYKDLVTFPSPVDRATHVGVEYVHVRDGVYDRSGTRSNKMEARRVAQLVFDHFGRFPDRSIGVVTFSEAQQLAIDAEIRNMRMENRAFESFFSEERDEPFFIKNLENVQGDERDTILFSVGYAKDANGVVHMNFGPLSKQGGQRRLNVAITRAKYNVKLVTSMKPSEIDLERTSAEGVKMLRRYIEFAMEGPRALQRQVSVSDDTEFGSPFEEAVYKELTYLGYQVEKQVGCSGYRIDLAVKDPDVSGRYLIGIECDGRTYHSSKTARDRDRLREEVLRGLGWRIHRVWSTDWIKDPRSEMQRLVSAIDEAKEAAETPELLGPSEIQPVDDPVVESHSEAPLEIVVEDLPHDMSDGVPGAVPYQECNIWSVPRNVKGDGPFVGDVLAQIVKTEGPVHQEIVARRVAPLFGNERVGSQLRRAVEYYATTYAAGRFIRRGEYFWPTSLPLKTVPVRTPGSSDKPRAIAEICVEERAEAMFLTLRQAIGMGVDALIVQTARLLGYNRTAVQIRDAMQEALDYLVSTRRVEVIEGSVRMTRK